MKKIAIFGYNRLSIETMSRLDLALHQVLVVVESDKEQELTKEYPFETSHIDFRNDDELCSIGIGTKIEIIFCFFSNDADNVFLTISARALDKNLHIIAVVEKPESAEKLLAAGANKIIDPYEICGRKIHELIKKPDMTNILDHTVFGHHDLNMAEVEVPKGCSLEGSYVCELNLNEEYNLILMGIVNKDLDKKLHFSMGEKQHKIDAGDILVVMGPAQEIKVFKRDVNHV